MTDTDRALAARNEKRYAEALALLTSHKNFRVSFVALWIAALCCEDLGRRNEREELYAQAMMILNAQMAALEATWAQSMGREGRLGDAKEKARGAIERAPYLVVGYQNWLCATLVLQGPEDAADEADQGYVREDKAGKPQ